MLLGARVTSLLPIEEISVGQDVTNDGLAACGVLRSVENVGRGRRR